MRMRNDEDRFLFAAVGAGIKGFNLDRVHDADEVLDLVHVHFAEVAEVVSAHKEGCGRAHGLEVVAAADEEVTVGALDGGEAMVVRGGGRGEEGEEEEYRALNSGATGAQAKTRMAGGRTRLSMPT